MINHNEAPLISLIDVLVWASALHHKKKEEEENLM